MVSKMDDIFILSLGADYVLVQMMLQILSSLLEQIPFAFSIRLAALASRKDYISLENWLNDSLSTFKGVFFEVG